MSNTPVEIDGALVSFDPLILKGDPGTAGAQGVAGPVGATTNLTMGTVTSVPSGQSASASLTGTAPNQVLNLVLPAGPTGSSGSGAVSSVAGKTGTVTLVESDITSLTTDLAAKAPLASPTFTGSPAAPTQTTGDSSTKIATDAFVATAVGVETARAQAAEATLAPLHSQTIWQQARSRAAFQPARVLSIGDSIPEGQGASAKSSRWFDLLIASLRNQFPSTATGGAGFIPPIYATFASDSPWTAASSTSGTIALGTSTGNPGYRVASMSTSATMTFTLVGTSMDLWLPLGGGSISYKIDAASAVTVSTTGTVNPANRVAGISLGAQGAHTVIITAVSAATFGGFTVYGGDETFGVMGFDSAHVGFTAANLVSDPLYVNTLAAIAPDVVLLEIEANSYLANSATPAQQAASMATLIGWLKALPKVPSIVMYGTYDLSVHHAPAGGQSTYATYKSTCAALAAADPTHITYLDLATTMLDSTQAGYASDGIHPLDGLQATIRDLILGQVGTVPTVNQLATETWSAANSSAWPNQWNVAIGASNTADIQSNQGHFVVTAGSFGAGPFAWQWGMPATRDCELLVDITFQTSLPAQYVFCGLRAPTQVSEGPQPAQGYFMQFRADTNTCILFRGNNDTGVNLSGNITFAPVSAAATRVRLRAVGNVISVKVWQATATEPSDWGFVYYDATPSLTAGKVALTCGNASGGSSSNCTFDNLFVTSAY